MDDATNPAPRAVREPASPRAVREPVSPLAPAESEPGADAPAGHRTRRWFLALGGALVVGAGAGTGAAFLHPVPKRRRKPPPRPPADLEAELTAAADAERALLADLDATSGGPPAVRQVIAQARADHEAHLAALLGLRRSLPKPAHRPARHEIAGTPRTQAQLRTAETSASATSAAAARRAAGMDGALAALFASIAACEATHAELLR